MPATIMPRTEAPPQPETALSLETADWYELSSARQAQDRTWFPAWVRLTPGYAHLAVHDVPCLARLAGSWVRLIPIRELLPANLTELRLPVAAVEQLDVLRAYGCPECDLGLTPIREFPCEVCVGRTDYEAEGD